MHFEGLFVRMKNILVIFIRNSYVYLIRHSVIPPLAEMIQLRRQNVLATLPHFIYAKTLQKYVATS